MRMTKLLGVVRRPGGPLVKERFGDYSPGDLVKVFPTGGIYPWADASGHLFRIEELEFLPEKELDLNDYL